MKTDSNKLYFRFKGGRDYIHGSDIFDALDAWFEESGQRVQELSFRHFSRNHLACVFDDPRDDITVEGKSVDEKGKQDPFWLVETPETVTERYSFDEEAITGHADIEGDTIEANATEGYSVIEQIIALTKALNYARTPDVDGKWVFGQLRLRAALPKEVACYRIRQKILLAGCFSVQEILLDGRAAGQIRFISSQS